MAVTTQSIAGRVVVPLKSIREELICVGFVAVSLFVWILSLRSVDIGFMSDYGLISVMPPMSFVALFILTVNFAILLRNPNPRPELLFAHIAALIFMLFGITSLVEDIPRFESTWKHVGVTDYVIRHGSVDPTIDAYFNWPGFFILLAFVTEITGLPSAMSLAQWAPAFLELLYLGPLILIFRRATDDVRLIWLSVWTFYLANWIGQDYLSPQGFNYFLYLCVLAILLTWFESGSASHPVLAGLAKIRIRIRMLDRAYAWIAPADEMPEATKRSQRLGLMVLVISSYVVITAGHQLTPFALLGATGLLVVFYRIRVIALPIVMAVIAVLWLRFLAGTYWAGHGSEVTGQVGSINNSVDSNMTNRLSGSRGHEIVVYIRTGMTLAFWAAAAVGVLFRVASGRRDFTFALLAAAPFPLVVAQSYGGEMLLRVYLFSLPFMAFFASAVFFRRKAAGQSWYTTISLITVCMIAFGLFFVTRFGNERQDYFTIEEVAASNYLYDVAPEGSLILAGTVKAPWKHRDYENHKHRTLVEEIEWDPALEDRSGLQQIEDLMRSDRYSGAYLFITRSQIANDQLFGLLSVPLGMIEREVVASGDFQLIYSNDDARIYVLKSDAGASP